MPGWLPPVGDVPSPAMRLPLPLALCLVLVACGSSDPVPGPDAASQGDVVGLDVAGADDGPHSAHDDVAVVDVAPMEASSDAVAVVDTSPAEATVDVAPEVGADAIAVVDTGPVDVHDAAPDSMCGGPPLAECVVEGVPMCVDIRHGRPGPSGTTIHCGMCGNTCATGQVCSELRCQTL